MILSLLYATAIIADDIKPSKKSKHEEDPAKKKIAELRSQLKKKELKRALTQPLEETVSAGKSLLGLGQRFGSWLGSMIKSMNSSNLESDAPGMHGSIDH